MTQEGAQGHCVVCGERKPHVFELVQLADVLRNAIQKHFEIGVKRYVPNDSDRNEYEPYGEELETVVSEIFGQEVEFFDELVEAIVDGEGHWPPDGGESFFGSNELYVRIKQREIVDYFSAHWWNLISELKHRRRFFSQAVLAFFSGLFKDIDRMQAWHQDVFNPVRGVVQELAQGMVVFRARRIEEGAVVDVQASPFGVVGPPPPHKARSGRMSPEGVVALYCAMEEETALAEIRPAIGEIAAVIGLAFTRKLRVLNFEHLERSLDGGVGEILDPDFEKNNSTRQFLRKLHGLISLPVVPGKEADYLITQAMAEYLAHVHAPRLDGIIFKSVQRAGGMNLVLFSEQDTEFALKETFPVAYSPDSLTFHRTERVKYKNVKLSTSLSPKQGMRLYAAGEYEAELEGDR
jgi:hypothetical protein